MIFFRAGKGKMLFLRRLLSEGKTTGRKRRLPPSEVSIERFRGARGNGGSALNAAGNAIRITHLPTGLQTRCDSTRDLEMNLELAHQRLFDLVEHVRNPETSRIALRENKERRRNAKARYRARKKYGDKQ